jgi:membrane-bound lytic murein transglycosylase D
MNAHPRLALAWVAAALLGACATQPVPPPVVPDVVAAPAPRAPVLEPRSPAPAPRAAEAPRLLPFDGERREVREPLRGIARIDRTAQHDDLWQRIRDGFAMPNLDSPLVAERVAWYAARPEYLARTLERSRRYLHHIVEELERRGMPTELALLPMVESSFNPMAYSRAHASGLWQFIPPTGKRYALSQNWWYDARRDIVASTSAALDYLGDLYEMHGDWQLALASYNWGENAVARALEKNRAAGLPGEYAHLTMPQETRDYVPKLQALKNIIANPEPFGIRLDPIPNQPYFTTITKTRDIDLRLAAELAEMPVEEFIALNPGFNRPFIPVAVNSRIVLPADRVEVFHANLEKRDDKTLVSWKAYTPQRGESLDAIAKKFGVALARLREVNGIAPRSHAMPSLLVVPLSGAADAARLPIMYAPPIALATQRTLLHRVKPGETLATIARRYRVSVDDLRRWNTVGRLTAGQTLKIQVRAASPIGKPARKAAKGKPRPKAKPVKK